MGFTNLVRGFTLRWVLFFSLDLLLFHYFTVSGQGEQIHGEGGKSLFLGNEGMV